MTSVAALKIMVQKDVRILRRSGAGVALISDYWLRDPAKIGVAIGVLSAFVMPLGVLALVVVRKPFLAAQAAEAAA